MISYSKQDTNSSCGPTALGNALKFLKVGSYHSLKKHLKKVSTYTPGEGVWLSNIDTAGRKLAKKHSFLFRRVVKPTYEKMAEALNQGYGLIVSYKWISNKGGHLVFVHGISKEGLATANEVITDNYEADNLHRWTRKSLWESRIKRGGFACWKVGYPHD